jgi:hypothetical protein
MKYLLVIPLILILAIAALSRPSGNAQAVIVPTMAPNPELVIAQALSQIAIDSATADRNTAHPSPTPMPPSETERIARTVAWPVALSLLCAGSLTALLVLALLWNTQSQRKMELERQRLAAEIANGRLDAIEKKLSDLAQK